MSIQDLLSNSFQAQFELNKNRNLFAGESMGQLKISSATRQLLEHNRTKVVDYFENGGVQELAHRLARQVKQELFYMNQYMDVREQDAATLQTVYEQLLFSIYQKLSNQSGQSYESIEQAHTQRLASWLTQINPLIQELNPAHQPYAKTVICSEYSPELQMKVLGLSLYTLQEPILDVGCGQHAQLVRYLRSRGFEAFGLDVLADEQENFVSRKNWFEFRFEPSSWGTILANLSFTNHFMHQHLQPNGQHADYAAKYMEMLHALRVGGAYHYAPSLPFVEGHLPKSRFTVQNTSLPNGFRSTIVSRIK